MINDNKGVILDIGFLNHDIHNHDAHLEHSTNKTNENRFS